MARPLQVPGQGALIPWTIRTTERSKDALTREASERGISVGALIDHLCNRAGLHR